jgi:hypothetical protein
MRLNSKDSENCCDWSDESGGEPIDGEPLLHRRINGEILPLTDQSTASILADRRCKRDTLSYFSHEVLRFYRGSLHVEQQIRDGRMHGRERYA